MPMYYGSGSISGKEYIAGAIVLLFFSLISFLIGAIKEKEFYLDPVDYTSVFATIGLMMIYIVLGSIIFILSCIFVSGLF